MFSELGAYDTTEGGGVLVGVTGLVRYGLLEGGAILQGGASPLSASFASVAGAAGVGWQSDRGLRLDALVTAGIDFHSGVGKGGFFSKDPGASGSLPFLGGRVGVTFRFGQQTHNHFELGFWGLVEDDLARRDVRYSYVEVPLLGTQEETFTASNRIGTLRVGGFLSLGATFDIGPGTSD